MVTQQQTNDLVALYAGYFNRAPDPAGLQFWTDQIDNGRAFNTIAADFASSPEAEALYPYLTAPGSTTSTSFISSIYQNLFNRNPDPAGLAFWKGKLADGSVNVADMIEAIINGARDDATATPPTFDKATLDNKIEVGLDFATKTDAAPHFIYDAAAAAAAVAALDGVTNDPTTVDAAKDAIDTYVTTGSYPGTPGQTFTLTTAAGEQITGTDNDDTFNAILGTGQTLNNFDSIEGGAGHDTMIILADGTISIPTSASVSNVETINFINTGVSGTINASIFTDANTIHQSGDSLASIKELANGQTVVFAGLEADVTLTMADGAASLNVVLDGVPDDSDIRFEGDALTTVSISGDVDDTPWQEIYLYDDTNDGSGNATIETLNISLSSDTYVDLDWGGSGFVNTTTLNAAGSTGDIEVYLTSLDSLETATFGSGADEVEAEISDDADTTYDLGAGNDTFIFDGRGDSENSLSTVTLGAGNDIFELRYGDLSNIVDADEAEFEAGMVIITDFNINEDLIDLNGKVGSLADLDNLEKGAISNAASLYDAIEEAAGFLGGDDGALFSYGGNAYVFHDKDGGGTFSDGDGLIQLTGVSADQMVEGVSFFA